MLGLPLVVCKFSVLLELAVEGGFIVKCLELPVASEGETVKMNCFLNSKNLLR